jgi:hypothetical protein
MRKFNRFNLQDKMFNVREIELERNALSVFAKIQRTSKAEPIFLKF